MMGKISKERLMGLFEELGVKWEEGWNGYLECNEDSFELLPYGALSLPIRKLKEENQDLRERLYSLWERHNRLMSHLGLEEVTYPTKTTIRKTPKAKSTPVKSKLKKG